MTFADLRTVLDPSLRLSVAGQEYVIQPPSARDGEILCALHSFALSMTSGTAPTEAQQDVLDSPDLAGFDHDRAAIGDTYQLLKADGVDHASIKHIAMTALLFWVGGTKVAEAFWVSQAASPASGRRAAKKTTPTALPTTPPTP